MNGLYNSALRTNSRQLRKNMTDAERHLWYDFLKNLPVTFHRQKIIGPYIADFYCASAQLVIELDGSQHYEEQGVENDITRDNYLKTCGLTVKRYSNTEIHQHFDAVCRDIYDLVFDNSRSKASP